MGITIGCLIGMTPLLFMDMDKKKKEDDEAAKEGKGANEAEAAANEATTSNLVVN